MMPGHMVPLVSTQLTSVKMDLDSLIQLWDVIV